MFGYTKNMKSRVRTSVVVIQNNRLLTFLGVDPTSGKEYFFLPGGKIEDDETAPGAAERETFEETGYQVQVDASSNVDREYEFFWDGETYDCLTIFYRAHLKTPMAASVRDADYNKGVHWIPLEEIDKVFSYSVPIRSAIEELL